MNKPNVVFILADDMGCGDVTCYNPNGKIPTPNLDRLAKSGMRYTDAHSSSAVCTPSRYGILTGRYCWRGELKKSVLWAWDKSIIEKDRNTVANIFSENGYNTACIGKWHLGWDWMCKDNSPSSDLLDIGVSCREKRAEIANLIDFDREITGGPVDCGFDSYFGIDVPNIEPYTWFVDRRVDPIPTVQGAFFEPHLNREWKGISAESWSLEDVSEKLSEKCVEYIENSSDTPFFLYYALTGPHTPIVPTERFIGSSGAGAYGDYVVMMDWAVGEVIDALERKGIAENTLIVFTCDNGPEVFAYNRILEHAHYSMGDMRGIKRDLWEGGHRVPTIASWPAVIPANTVCDETISLLDFFATSADILGYDIPEHEAEDSLSFLPTFTGKPTDKSLREGIIYHSCSGKFSLRVGDWVYIDEPTGDDNNEPDWFKKERGYTEHHQPKELYNLSDDPQQAHNLYGTLPEREQYMSSLLQRYQQENRSRNYT